MTLFIKKVKGDILLVQVYVDDIIFRSTKKSLCTEFEKLMHKKFQMSSMGELTFFLGLQVTQKDDGIFISQDKYVDKILKKFSFSTVKTASTPMEISKPLMKDENAKDVDVHLYRSMIGSLMYLTSSRYNIAGASLDRKSTTGGCQFLGSRLISWQCKKQTVVANSTTEANFSPLNHNVADLLTKAFDVSRFQYLIARWLEWSAKAAKDEIEVKTGNSKVNVVGHYLVLMGENEIVHEERGDSIERAATTAASLDVEQDSGSGPRRQDTILGDRPAQTRFERLSKQSNDYLSQELTHLETEVSKVVKKKKERTPQLKRRLFKVRIESSADKSLGDQEDASKQGRDIAESDQDKEISFVQRIEIRGGMIIDIDVSTAVYTNYTVDVSTLMKMKSEKSKEKLKEKSKEKGVSSETALRPTRGVTIQEPKKPSIRRTRSIVCEEIAKRRTEELEAELEEEEKLAKQRE
ncbi:putative ribonuclease H-like domain-containing protein [Tanacetum coccineum]